MTIENLTGRPKSLLAPLTGGAVINWKEIASSSKHDVIYNFDEIPCPLYILHR